MPVEQVTDFSNFGLRSFDLASGSDVAPLGSNQAVNVANPVGSNINVVVVGAGMFLSGRFHIRIQAGAPGAAGTGGERIAPAWMDRRRPGSPQAAINVQSGLGEPGTGLTIVFHNGFGILVFPQAVVVPPNFSCSIIHAGSATHRVSPFWYELPTTFPI